MGRVGGGGGDHMHGEWKSNLIFLIEYNMELPESIYANYSIVSENFHVIIRLELC